MGVGIQWHGGVTIPVYFAFDVWLNAYAHVLNLLVQDYPSFIMSTPDGQGSYPSFSCRVLAIYVWSTCYGAMGERDARQPDKISTTTSTSPFYFVFTSLRKLPSRWSPLRIQ